MAVWGHVFQSEIALARNLRIKSFCSCTGPGSISRLHQRYSPPRGHQGTQGCILSLVLASQQRHLLFWQKGMLSNQQTKSLTVRCTLVAEWRHTLMWIANSLNYCSLFGLLYVSGKLPTYPSPKPTFCPKWELSVIVGLGEGLVGSFLDTYNDPYFLGNWYLP